MAKAWVYQDTGQVRKRGPEAAAWYVGWYDPAGKRRRKSCGPGSLGKKNAERLRTKVEAELIEGTYRRESDRKTWTAFREEFERKVIAGKIPASQRVMRDALNQFERLVKPVRMAGIRTQTIDDFRVRRSKERGKKVGSLVSPASVNKALRHLRAALIKAHKWGYLAVVPDVAFSREPGKLVRFVTGEHFAQIYAACKVAKKPQAAASATVSLVGADYPAADWWRALLVMAYMTGWRICELLALRRQDLDLDEGFAITRAADNKGKRDERVKLHPVIVEHLRRLPATTRRVFPWDQSTTSLMKEFRLIQEAAGVHLPCSEEHAHTRSCHVYGFHDFRRAFATMNAERLTGDALMKLMRHKAYATTQRYINLARQLDQAVEVLHVPEVLKLAARG